MGPKGRNRPVSSRERKGFLTLTVFLGGGGVDHTIWQSLCAMSHKTLKTLDIVDSCHRSEHQVDLDLVTATQGSEETQLWIVRARQLSGADHEGDRLHGVGVWPNLGDRGSGSWKLCHLPVVTASELSVLMCCPHLKQGQRGIKISKSEFLLWRLPPHTLTPLPGRRPSYHSFQERKFTAFTASPPTRLPVSCLLCGYFLQTETSAPGERTVKETGSTQNRSGSWGRSWNRIHKHVLRGDSGGVPAICGENCRDGGLLTHHQAGVGFSVVLGMPLSYPCSCNPSKLTGSLS